jgi:hypothetical protein
MPAGVPVSPTSQCVEGPGAPPADPSKVTRVPAGTDEHGRPLPPEEPPIDEPVAGRAPVLLELGAFAGGSVRVDDGPLAEMTRRGGLLLGGSAFVWPTRTWALGLTYAHVDLNRVEGSSGTGATARLDYDAHSLLAEARVAPWRVGPAAIFITVGAGLAWQTVELRGTLPSVDGQLGAPVSCSSGSNMEFAFRAGLGTKVRIGRAAALLVEGDFSGYRFSSDVLGDCAPGAGTAQTLLLRAGFAYDLDVSRFVR